MYTPSTTGHGPATGKHHGPHPGILAVVYTILLIASLVAFGVLSHGAKFPRPFGLISDAARVYLGFPTAVRVNALLQIASAIPLGLLAAALTSRLRFLGVTATGVNIAAFGGTTAAIGMLLSGTCAWVLSQPGIVAGDLTAMRSLQLLSFGSGGIVFSAALGLLMAGISVPCLFTGWVPRWLSWTGIVLAGVGQVALLALLCQPLDLLLPVVRFGSIVWMIGMGFAITKAKPAVANRS